MSPTALPRPMTLPALQRYVARVVEERGFYRDPRKIFILLTEEVGELATEIRRLADDPGCASGDSLGFELADTLLYLLDLANGFGQDLEERRHGAPPREIPGAAPSLNALLSTAGNEADGNPERLLLRLIEALGAIANEVRKSWKHKGDPAVMGEAMAHALACLLRIARHFRIDLEAAVAAKEKQNADRTWSF